MTMLEWIARHMCAGDGHNPDGWNWRYLGFGDRWWTYYMPRARAAVQAMRIPPEPVVGPLHADLIDAGHVGRHGGYWRPETAWYEPAETFNAMLDAILAERDQ